MTLFWLVIFLVFSLEIRLSSAECPSPEISHPCQCQSATIDTEIQETIVCEDHDIDLKSTLNRISGNRRENETHFNRLSIINSSFEEIESDVLGNLTFNHIKIWVCPNLRRIHWLAFNNTADRLISFTLSHSPEYSISLAPYNLFDMLNSFKNLDWIYLTHLNITHIPSNAFESLSSLTTLALRNFKSLSLDDKAFYNLTNLNYLDWHLDIDYLPANVLQFASDSNTTLFLNFNSNNLTDSSFDSGWLNNINRPVIISLVHNNIWFLNQTVFEPFLNDTRNRIWSLYMNPLGCSDCRNAWLKNRQDEFKDRVCEPFCYGIKKGPTIFDINFDHCQ